MLKKLVPAVLGALLLASPVIAVTTAAAAPQAARPRPMTVPSQGRQAQEGCPSCDEEASVMKKHSKAKKKAPPKG